MRKPSWWMPASCAKALRADDRLVRLDADADDLRQQLAGRIKLLGLDAGLVGRARRARVFSTITISSSEQLPARSPMPLTVHSTWRAPFWIAAERVGDRQAEIVVAVDADDAPTSPSALRDLADQRAVLLGDGVADGVGDVDRGGAGGDDRARDRRSGSRARCAPPSSAENSTSSTYLRASSTAATASSSTCARVFFSLYLRWMSLVARKMWMRGGPLRLVQRLGRPLDVQRRAARERRDLDRNLAADRAAPPRSRPPTRWGSRPP